MEPLYIKGTEDCPEIILDKDKQLFEISGKSLPEDVSVFFSPVIKWFENYIKDPLPGTALSVRMTYFNTASSKLLLDIFILLEEVEKKNHDIVVNWYYPSYDEEMKDAGIEYSEMLDLKFNILLDKTE